MISWSTVTKSPDAVGRRVSLFWPGDERWYEGVVRQHRKGKGFLILYDDGDEEWIKSLEEGKFIDEVDGEERGSGGNSTWEGQEHDIQKKYEESIRLLSSSEEKGDAHWELAKNNLLLLASKESILFKCHGLSEKLLRIKYLVCKNLCHLHDTESNYQEAMEYGLLALEMCEDLKNSDISLISTTGGSNKRQRQDNSTPSRPSSLRIETYLVLRVADLAIKTGNLWTCHALLFSPILASCMEYARLTLYNKWKNAMKFCAGVECIWENSTDHRLSSHSYILTLSITSHLDGSHNLDIMPFLSQLFELLAETRNKRYDVCSSDMSLPFTLIVHIHKYHISRCREITQGSINTEILDMEAASKKREVRDIEMNLEGDQIYKRVTVETTAPNESAPIERSGESFSKMSESEGAMDQNENSAAEQTRTSDRPETDRLTRQQRKKLPSAADKVIDMSSKSFDDAIGSALWENKLKEEFDSCLLSLQQESTQCLSYDNDDAIAFLIKWMLCPGNLCISFPLSPSSPSSPTRNNVFLDASTSLTPCALLMHNEQARLRSYVRLLFVDGDLVSESTDCREVRAHVNPEKLSILQTHVHSSDWKHLFELLNLDAVSCSAGVPNAAQDCVVTSARVNTVEMLICFISSAAKMVSRIVACANTSSASLSGADVDDFCLLRNTVVDAWQTLVSCFQEDVERVVSKLSLEEALLVGECIVHKHADGRMVDESISKNCFHVLFLLLHRWEACFLSSSEFIKAKLDEPSSIRMYWLCYHSWSLISCHPFQTNKDYGEIGDNMHSSVSYKDFGVNILYKLCKLLGNHEFLLPHLIKDSKSDSLGLPIAKLSEVVDLSVISSEVIAHIQAKKESAFSSWVHERCTKTSPDDQFMWLSRVHEFFCLPSPSKEGRHPRFALQSLLQKHLVGNEEFAVVCQDLPLLFPKNSAIEKEHLSRLGWSRFAFALTLLKISLQFTSLFQKSEANVEKFVKGKELFVQLTIFILHSLEECEGKLLFQCDEKSKCRISSPQIQTVVAVFVFLAAALKLYPVSYENNNLSSPDMVSCLTTMVNQWLLVSFSSQVQSQEINSSIALLQKLMLQMSMTLADQKWYATFREDTLVNKNANASSAIAYLSFMLCFSSSVRHKSHVEDPTCSNSSSIGTQFHADMIESSTLNQLGDMCFKNLSDSTWPVPCGMKGVLSEFAYSMLSFFNTPIFFLGICTVDQVHCLQVLSDGTTIYHEGDSLYNAEKGAFMPKNSASQRLASSSALASTVSGSLYGCFKAIIRAMTEKLLATLPSSINVSEHGVSAREVYTESHVDIFISYIVTVKYLYEMWISSNRLYFIDGGVFSKHLADTLVYFLKEAYRTHYYDKQVTDIEAQCDQIGNGDEKLLVPLLEMLPDGYVVHLLTLLGQIYFDLYKLPVASSFIRFKEAGIGMDVAQGSCHGQNRMEENLVQLENLFTFIKYCEDEMGNGGVGKGDIRASYGFLYSSFSILHSPAVSGYTHLLSRENELFSCLFGRGSKTSECWLKFISASPPDMDRYFVAIIQGCFEKLIQHGLPEGEYKVDKIIDSAAFGEDGSQPETEVGKALVPFPLREGDSIATRNVNCFKDQGLHKYPFFGISAPEAQSYASINLFINSLIHYYVPHDIEGGDCELALVLISLYEKMVDMLIMCLDDIGYNVFPLRNLDCHGSDGSKALSTVAFSNVFLHRHVACGTLFSHGKDALKDVMSLYQSENDSVYSHFDNNAVYWEKWDSGNGVAPDIGRCRGRSKDDNILFVNSLHGGDSPQNERRPDISSSSLSLVLFIAKLHSLLDTSENVLNGLLQVYSPIEKFVKEKQCSEPTTLERSSSDSRKRRSLSGHEQVAQRMGKMYESRCQLYSILMQVYHKQSERYTAVQNTAAMSALKGLQAQSLLVVPDSCDWGSECPPPSLSDKLFVESRSSDSYPDDSLEDTNGPSSSSLLSGGILNDGAVCLCPTSCEYFLPFMYGKLLFRKKQEEIRNPSVRYDNHILDRINLMALRYITHAKEACRRASLLDKSEKKYRATILAELQRVRICIAMERLELLGCEGASSMLNTGLFVDMLGHDMLRKDFGTFLESCQPHEEAPLSGKEGAGVQKSLLSDMNLCSSCGSPVVLSESEDATCTESFLLISDDNVPFPECHLESRSNEEASVETRLALWKVIVDSLRCLKHCKEYDPYDFKSVLYLCKYIFGLWKLLKNNAQEKFMRLRWALPSQCILRQLEMANIEVSPEWCAKLLQKRMFDKKRPQIVGIWVQESSDNRFEQLLQRIIVFDNLRFKLFKLYIECCCASLSLPRLSDVLSWVHSSYGKQKNGPAWMKWAMRTIGLAFVDAFERLLFKTKAFYPSGDSVQQTTAENEGRITRALCEKDFSALYRLDLRVHSCYSYDDLFRMYYTAVDKSVASGGDVLSQKMATLLLQYYIYQAEKSDERLKLIRSMKSSLHSQDGAKSVSLGSSDGVQLISDDELLPKLISAGDSSFKTKSSKRENGQKNDDAELLTVENILIWCRRRAEWQSSPRSSLSPRADFVEKK